jgi:hypothetical protein
MEAIHCATRKETPNGETRAAVGRRAGRRQRVEGKRGEGRKGEK